MFGKLRISRWLVGTVMLVALECMSSAALQTIWSSPAQAQWGGDHRYPFRQRQPRRGGFLQELFGPFYPREHRYGRPRRGPRVQPAPHVDHSRAPPPRKAKKGVPPPTTTILVMGDSMANWLAYGLEDAFSDTPSVGVVRKYKRHSGLIRYQAKSDLDWWHQARDLLTQERANYVVMMLGLNDRKNIRERDLAKEAEKQQAEKEHAEKTAEKNGDKSSDKSSDRSSDKSSDRSSDKNKSKKTAAKPSKPKPRPKPKPSNAIIKFRSDRWAEVYAKRIDRTIAALKSKGVPVFWVGLPPIRGSKSTADAAYLDDLFRARAERVGIVYIDIWDGFIADSGKYSSYGPDYKGQIRRLRTSDGVFFTKYGARKLAHYVEREIRRYMRNPSLQIALPTGPGSVQGKSTMRPIAGPVIPLTTTIGVPDELLLGGAGSRTVHRDSIAAHVLVKGEPVAARPGRADDYSWPPGSSANHPRPSTADAQMPAASKQSLPFPKIPSEN